MARLDTRRGGKLVDAFVGMVKRHASGAVLMRVHVVRDSSEQWVPCRFDKEHGDRATYDASDPDREPFVIVGGRLIAAVKAAAARFSEVHQ